LGIHYPIPIINKENYIKKQVKKDYMLTKTQIEKLEKQQYRMVGSHSVVKICFWNKEVVRNKDKVCYKEHFYDVHCGNCLEMSPVITCNQRCLHCWRDTSVFSKGWEGGAEDPKEIIKGCIEARKKLLIGFKGFDKVDKLKFESYLVPDHAAISLTGEPTLYPKLPQMIDSFFEDYNFRTVFLVTNGTNSEMLKKIGIKNKHFPTNIFLSLESTDLENYKSFNFPVGDATDAKRLWDNIEESMRYLSTIKDKTKTILRITAIQKINMDQATEFVQHVKLMQPTHIETKGYSWLGHSRKRLKEENVPTWEEVQGFASELGELCGYEVTNVHEPSMIVQLRKKK